MPEISVSLEWYTTVSNLVANLSAELAKVQPSSLLPQKRIRSSEDDVELVQQENKEEFVSIANPLKIINLGDARLTLCAEKVEGVRAFFIEDDPEGGLPLLFTVKTEEYDHATRNKLPHVTATVFDPLTFIVSHDNRDASVRTFPGSIKDMILPHVLNVSQLGYSDATSFLVKLRESLNGILLCFYGAIRVNVCVTVKDYSCFNQWQTHRNITVALHALYRTSLQRVSHSDTSPEHADLIKQAWKHFVNNLFSHHTVTSINKSLPILQYKYVFYDIFSVLSKFIAIANTTTIPLNYIKCVPAKHTDSLHSRDNYYHIKNLSLIADGTQENVVPSFFPSLSTMVQPTNFNEYDTSIDLTQTFTYYNIFEAYLARRASIASLQGLANTVRFTEDDWQKVPPTSVKNCIVRLRLSCRMILALCMVRAAEVKDDLVATLKDFAKLLVSITVVILLPTELQQVLKEVSQFFRELCEDAQKHVENEYIMSTLSCALADVAHTPKSTSQGIKLLMMYMAWCPRDYCSVGKDWFIEAADKFGKNNELYYAGEELFLRSYLMAVCRHYPELFLVDSEDRVKFLPLLYESLNKSWTIDNFSETMTMVNLDEYQGVRMVIGQLDYGAITTNEEKYKCNKPFHNLVGACKTPHLLGKLPYTQTPEAFAVVYKAYFGTEVHNDGWKRSKVTKVV